MKKPAESPGLVIISRVSGDSTLRNVSKWHSVKLCDLPTVEGRKDLGMIDSTELHLEGWKNDGTSKRNVGAGKETQSDRANKSVSWGQERRSHGVPENTLSETSSNAEE